MPGASTLGADARSFGARADGRRRASSVFGSGTLSAADTVLALGLLLSPSSQMRPGSSPIGPGEACLLVWLGLMLGREAVRLGPPLTAPLRRLLIFWALFAVALSLGTMTAFLLQDRHDPVWFAHDIMAYLLLAGVSCWSVVEPGAAFRLHRVAWLLISLGSLSLALQLADAWGMLGVRFGDPWYWTRFRGWSENPAQLSILCAALALLALHLAETAARPGQRIAAIAGALLPIYVGRLTGTDTFTLVLVIAGPLFVALKLRTWLLSSERNISLRPAAAWIAALALPLMLASAVPLVPSMVAESAALAKQLSKNHGADAASEADLRLHLWGEAWRRGLESGMLGLGPGPHLRIPASIVAGRIEENSPGHIPHPANNGTPNFEAHNTLFDLFTQGGILAVSTFFWLIATAFLKTYKAGFAGLTTSLCGLLLLGMSLLIIRHPVFWFVVALCLVAGAGQSPGRAAMTHSRRPA